MDGLWILSFTAWFGQESQVSRRATNLEVSIKFYDVIDLDKKKVVSDHNYINKGARFLEFIIRKLLLVITHLIVKLIKATIKLTRQNCKYICFHGFCLELNLAEWCRHRFILMLHLPYR